MLNILSDLIYIPKTEIKTEWKPASEVLPSLNDTENLGNSDPDAENSSNLPTDGNDKEVLVLAKTGKGVPLVGVSDKLYLNISSEAIDKLYELYKNGSFDDTISPVS